MEYNAFNCNRYNVDHITTINQVKDFANYLVNDLKVNIHPDNDFSEYIEYSTFKPTFDDNGIKRGNQLMEECFSVCEEHSVGIYDLMSEYLFDF